MMSPRDNPVTRPCATWPAGLAWVIGGLSVLPLLFLHQDFARLFWFGDEWDLLDQVWRTGFWTWTFQAFAENFVPLFKLLWFGLVVLGDGDYRLMIGVLWFTHAVNVALFGLLLREGGLGWLPSVFSMAIFGLTPTNLETLGWSVQWSAVLATTFFLWAAWWQTRHLSRAHAWSWKHHGVLFLLCAASALCFSRGVVTGCALAAIALWPVSSSWMEQWPQRLRTGVICFLPAFVVALLIVVTQPGGNHHHLGEDGDRLFGMARYAAWYFGMNPFHRLLGVDSWGWRTTTLLAAAKIALVIWGLRRSNDRTRRLLALLLIFDIGNAALLGIGRFHTGLPTANSSRYQYASLICTLPFLAVWLEHLLGKVRGLSSGRPRAVVGIAVVLVATFLVVRSWPEETEPFTVSRGQYTRDLLTRNPHPPAEEAIPGIPFLPTARAKELMQHYNLH